MPRESTQRTSRAGLDTVSRLAKVHHSITEVFERGLGVATKKKLMSLEFFITPISLGLGSWIIVIQGFKTMGLSSATFENLAI